MPDDGDIFGQIKQKLVDTKQKWARDGRLLTGEKPVTAPVNRKLPPGQREVKNWPVLDLGVQPVVTPKEWQLTVGGMVENPLTWSWTELMDQPVFQDTSDMHCVTAWSRYDNRWEGVSARHLLSLARPKPEAKFVILKSYDGYTTNVPLSAFDDEDVLLATKWEGKAITREHGGPVRLILPKLYLWKSAKWLRNIWFTDKDTPGFWEVRGYHNTGDPWKEERYG
ncbi:MAG: sulfite oxidase-like oxidoreductase [Alphaproteobacteria bacterium]|nr:sulfite oxidase-like oxidoreductase [Alphaproteobacteria bacterium]MBU0887466.1 sulfite oxidase-like oxidoreductase [Alphaproteobacteria bacterium]MBU1813325.1 sulfite oxidase-like oxidoreductase [Alphaproteobacteria bacterium]MBU2089870.1 sulfite oxidase-like oxidoreductase [Alphaproteobacteria bacterium]